MAAYTPSQPSGGAGFSLKLKLGSTTHNPPAAAAPTPAPPSFDHSGLSQLANSALQHEMAPPAPIAAPAPSAQGGGQQQQWSAEGSRQGEVDEREARGVTSAKYRELKRKYNEVVEVSCPFPHPTHREVVSAGSSQVLSTLELTLTLSPICSHLPSPLTSLP